LKIAVLTAGGMNATVRAVARAAFFRGWEVVGVEDGFEGILEEVVGEERPLDLAMYELAEMPQ
jgi:6-phosphofructokinase 1